MRITYTGQATFSPVQQKKVDAKFAKLSKLFDRGGEKEAHVILTAERHLHRTEITVRYYDHSLVGLGSHADTVTSISEAVEKIEKQMLKLRAKWRDTKRTPSAKSLLAAPPAAPANHQEKTKVKVKVKPKATAGAADGAGKRVFKVDQQGRHKPMTTEEAMLEFDDARDYMVYRDADSDRTHVLVKRRDGHFDLIES